MSKIDKLLEELCPDGVLLKKIGDVCQVLTGGDTPLEYIKGLKEPKGEYKYPIYANGSIDKGLYGYSKSYRVDKKSVTVTSIGTIGFHLVREPFYTPIIRLKVIIPKEDVLSAVYLNYILYTVDFVRTNSSLPSMNADNIKSAIIPVPPLEVQNEIVRILDNFTELEEDLEAELEARTKQYEYYRNKHLDFSTGSVGVPRVDKMLAEMCPDGIEFKTIDAMIDYIQPSKYIVSDAKYRDDFEIPVLTAGKTFILGYTNEVDGIFISDKNKPVMIFDDFTTSMHWVDFDFKVKSSALKILVPKDSKYNFRFLYYALKVLNYQKADGTHERHWISKYSKLEIQVPPLEIQNEIVEILDKFSEYTTSISQGLPAEIAARRKQYEYYRNKLLTF